MFKKTDKKLSFKNEECFEVTIINHLKELLGLELLARQLRLQGEICDLLTIDSSRQAYILELKNIEDRYIVQQLTRYYHYLRREKPFSQSIDYNQDIRLVAIQPQFHKHNFIDRCYSKLQIDFYQFSILEVDESIILNLRNIDNDQNFSAVLLNQRSRSESKPESSLEVLDHDQDQEKRLKAEESLRLILGVRYASKLGLKSLQLSELEQKKLSKIKGSKIFQIVLKGFTERENRKSVSIRVPSSIGVHDFSVYVLKHIPTAFTVKTPNGRQLPVYGYYNVPIWKTYESSDVMFEPLDIYKQRKFF